MVTKREFIFGRYRLEPGRGLFADGEAVPISAKALDVLATLVEEEGRLVTKDELMERVWAGIVVDEHNIQVHISALRKLLGDNAAWIRTVPRLGYRFIGPLKAAAPEGKVPARRLGRLFGRERDLAAIGDILWQARLVTIAGPGGIGKTSLALEVAGAIGDRYRDGSVFVDLSVLQDSTLAMEQVAEALGIELKGNTPPAELLAHRLQSRQLLIVLDNCEHVVAAVAPLAELILATAPSVSLLATSREPLGCRGEQVYRLPLLTVPSDKVGSAVEALEAASVALLVNRLQAADLHFELTDAMTSSAAAICRRLDGLPLAIEMVAATVSSFGLETVALRLEEAFRLPHSVTRTMPPRHRSLEATLDWSHALLSVTERVMLRRLAVFQGRFSLPAVEAVLVDATMTEADCGDVLARLVRKSLVSINLAAAPRSYRLLLTIRSYAAEKLEAAGEERLLRARHARYVGDVLARAMGDWEETADTVWIDRYGWLITDIRAALQWSFKPDGDPAIGMMLSALSRPLWRMLNLNGEGRRWAEVAVAALGPETPDDVAASVWFAVGYLTGGRWFERSTLALQNAAELFGRLNDLARRGEALAVLGQMLAMARKTASAAEVLVEARHLLEQQAGTRRLGVCAQAFGMLHGASGSWAAARQEFETARVLFQAVGAKRLATSALCNLADVMWAEGELSAAIETARSALDLARRDNHRRYIGLASGYLAGMLTLRGDLDEALVAAREAVPLCREDEYIEWLFPHLALRVAKAGRPDEAALIWGYAERNVEPGVERQINEQRAADMLMALLSGAIESARLDQLMAAGRYLSEDQIIALTVA
jgi:predicted ATPase/DNA-binding winged helix-turn-helix (wHTH) protein